MSNFNEEIKSDLLTSGLERYMLLHLSKFIFYLESIKKMCFFFCQ